MELDNNVLLGIIGFLGTATVGGISYFTARLARKSAQAQTNVEERAKVIEAYDKLNEDLENRNAKLNEELSKLESRMDALEAQRREDRDRIWRLEEDKVTQRAAIRTIINYCDLLVELLETHGINVPTEPDEMRRFAQDKSPPPNKDS